MSLPPITIVVTTYAPPGEAGVHRRNAALSAWQSWREHLKYEGELRVHIADDGSELVDYTESWWKNLNRRHPLCPLGNLTYSRQERWGVGASLNAGFREAYKDSLLTLYAVDDWGLRSQFDLTPWVDLLTECESIGAVRLGPPHPDLTGTIEHYPRPPSGKVSDGLWYLRLDRHHFAFSHRPTLFHKRLTDAYGPFDEDISALECEQLYNERFCATAGPDIVLALPTPWEHNLAYWADGVKNIELADVVPGGRK